MLNNINDLLLVAKSQESQEPIHEVLESITFNKTQMFWLPVKPAPDVKIDITFKSNNTSETQCLIGGRIIASGSNRKMFAFWECVGGSSSISGYMRADYGNSSTASNDIGLSSTLTDFRNFVKDGADNYIDGVEKPSNTGILEEDDTNTYIALGCMSNGTVSNYSLSNPFSGDVAQLKIWKAGTQVADYVPALDYLLRPCLYNRITKEFLYAKIYPSGSTTTYDLGFKRWNKFDVDYISFTGTQYIDLGLTASYTSLDNAPVCEFEGKIDTLPSSATTMQRFVSAGGSGTGEKYYQIFINWNTSGTPKIPIGFQCGSASPYMEAREADTNWHYYKYDIPNKEAFIDDISYDMTSYTSTSVSIPYNLYIGARNLSGTPDRFLIGSLKYLKWSVGGQLIRNLKSVVWHNGDTTAEACLYDEVYNKMYPNLGTGSFKAYIEDIQVPYTLAQHDNMDIQLGNGAYINASGVVTTDTASCYTKAIPVSAGDVITLTVTGRATTSVFNKRIHAYTADDGTISLGSKGSWVSQLGHITFPIGQTNYTTQTLSVTIPSGVNYIRLSHALRTGDDVILETQCDLTITRTYEVGTYIQTLKSSTVQTTGYMIDLGIEPKDGIGYHIKTSTNINSSNYVFGARKVTSIPSQQSNKPILVGLTGSQTGGTVLSSVMGASATWASDGTNWVRPSSSTSSYVYECSMQTYKENNELKFNVIGYNYTLAKNADKQTLTYTDAINNADEADMSTLHIGGLNANNILNGNNAYFFIECRQPNTDMTLLPVVNNNQFYLIDNNTKQTYQFYKVGSPTPATDNIRIKKLDGTFIDGTL